MKAVPKYKSKEIKDIKLCIKIVMNRVNSFVSSAC